MTRTIRRLAMTTTLALAMSLAASSAFAGPATDVVKAK